MVMEQTRGIGRSLAKDFLTMLMARFAEEFPDRFVAQKRKKRAKDKPESVSYRPTVGFQFLK